MLYDPRLRSETASAARPILKWAGGKTQLLEELLARAPKSFDRYIEPFFGGGALFFALNPKKSIISDVNPEIMNLYQQVAANVDAVIRWLSSWENSEEVFYRLRALDWKSLVPVEAAARTIYLNKTCFNGLYRVNKKGEFNTPFGRYENPNIVNSSTLFAASTALSASELICGDFRKVLARAKENDFIFLDPPYIPVSESADFKRYTKDQFSIDDHVALAKEVSCLTEIGCHVLLTNSDNPLVFELYKDYSISTVDTKRFISCDGKKRTGRDTIVEPKEPRKGVKVAVHSPEMSEKVCDFPTTRYMGSKTKLLSEIWSVASRFEFDTVVDLFSGSGIVSYMFKCQNKRVLSNDHMAMAGVFTRALVENSNAKLDENEVRALLAPEGKIDDFVRSTFAGLYYNSDDEFMIDVLRTNIFQMENAHKRSVALAALIRACLKKRPRGIFTFTGARYDDGRVDLRTSITDHFSAAINTINAAIFENGRASKTTQIDALDVEIPSGALVYMDPPYWSPLSDNEYVRRYHFVEGLARNWEGVEIQTHTTTKKFKSYKTPFKTRAGTVSAFETLLGKCSSNPVVISYSSNSEPNLPEMSQLIKRHKKNLDIVKVNHKYSFGNQKFEIAGSKNSVDEYLFVGW
jgi:DNA adenine methylase